MNTQFVQSKGSTSKETNKESIARIFGVKKSEVTYAVPGTMLQSFRVIYDKSLQRSYTLPNNYFSETSALTSLTKGVLVGTNMTTIDLAALAVRLQQWNYILSGNFLTGTTITQANDVVNLPGVGWYRWGGSIPDAGYVVAPGTLPDIATATDQPGWFEIDVSSLRYQMSRGDGLRFTGRLPNATELRNFEPVVVNQKIDVVGYAANSKIGGGYFVYDSLDTTTTDDGFLCFVTPGGKRWKRVLDNNVVTPQMAGGQANGTVDDAAFINTVLAGGNKTVYFPAGNYLIKSYLRVYKNTTIIMSKGCVIQNDNQTAEFVFVNGELNNNTYATGYDGEGNIIIQGGTIDNAIRAGKSLATKAIAIGHATNVTIRNVTFMNNYQSHFVEINSTKGALIEGCRFYNLNPGTTSTDGSRECINIDFASAAGFPEFGGYDNTVCDDVKVVNCQFSTGDVGVGTHGVSPLGPHKRINVSNNVFRDMQSVGVSAWFWDESIVHGNKLVNCGTRCMKIWGCTSTVVSGNTIDGGGSIAQMTLDSNGGITTNGISVVGNTFVNGVSHEIRCVIAYNVLFSGNVFKDSVGSGILTSSTAYQLTIDGNHFYNCGQSTAASCIRVASPNCKVSNNKITGLDGSILYGTGIYLEDTAVNASLSDNDITPGVTQSVRYPLASLKIGETNLFSIAPDSVVSIAIETSRKQGLLLVGSSTKEIGPNGSLFMRANAGEEDLTKIATLGTFATSTAVLTGTTGAAGQVTLSVNAGKLYIENRISGSNTLFRIQLMTV